MTKINWNDKSFASKYDVAIPQLAVDNAYDRYIKDLPKEPIAKCVTYKGINHRGNY